MLQTLVLDFKALSDPNRIRILEMLKIRPLCVCEITHVLQLATSTVSKHLSILRKAGFIINEKEGKWANYRLLKPKSTQDIHQITSMMSKCLSDDSVIREDAVKVESVNRYEVCKI